MMELISLYVPVALVAVLWLAAVRRPLAVLSAPKRRARR